MTTGSRAAAVVVGMALHVALGLVIIATAFPLIGARRREACIRWWSRRLLGIMRVSLRVVPPAHARRPDVVADALRPRGRGALLVMNHVSWLDIFVVHAVRAAHFIAKAEIARWPLLGFLVAGSGTFFIERGRRHAVRGVNHRVAAALASDALVAFFPEGTTGDGARLLPFHANLIQPAIDAGVPVVVAALRYRATDGGPTSATLYVGDTTLVQSLVRIARGGPIVAELVLLDALEAGGETRHAIGRRARAMIGDALGVDDDPGGSPAAVVAPAISPVPAPRDTAPRRPLDLRGGRP